MPAGPITSISTARWLVGVIASVVLCFVAAAAVGEHLEGAIAGRANQIISNAMPSVQLLTTASGDLRRLELELERYAAAPAEEQAARGDRISAMRHDVEGSLATYLALPFFPSEPELFKHVKDGLKGLDEQLADFLPRPDPSKLEGLHHEFDIVDEAIQRIVSLDATQGQLLGLEIERIRGETRGITVLLDAASVALAVGAAYLALRQLQRATRAQRVEREARERRETELAAQNEALGQFAGRVAHDVLSPLSTSMLALELIRRVCEQDPAASRATERGMAAIAQVQTLVDGLLAFSRAGGRPDPGASAELAPVIADVVDGLIGQARERQIDLCVSEIPAGAVSCSRGVLTSVVSNLVRNAIKYIGDAPERRIELRAIDAKERWRIEVEDTGPGIPAEHQQRIFQPYVRLGRGGDGIGLGLATVDRLVRAHAGSLGLISQSPGCLFWFELPKASPRSS